MLSLFSANQFINPEASVKFFFLLTLVKLLSILHTRIFQKWLHAIELIVGYNEFCILIWERSVFMTNVKECESGKEEKISYFPTGHLNATDCSPKDP